MLMRAPLMLSLMMGITISSAGQTRPMNLQPVSLRSKGAGFLRRDRRSKL